MFLNRKHAAMKLAEKLKPRSLQKPVILGIPRGGVILAATIAKELDADLDVLLSRKIRAPFQPELAIGAVGEDGYIYLYHPELADPSYLNREKKVQIAEMERRRRIISSVTKHIDVSRRSVVIVDDGIATGSTLIAGLHTLKNQDPFETIVVAPVASMHAYQEIKPLCDDVVCLKVTDDFFAVSQFYKDFKQVTDEEMLAALCGPRKRSLAHAKYDCSKVCESHP